MKGVAAYADHAQILGQEDQKVYDFVYDALNALLTANMPLGDWLAMVLKCGEINLRAMGARTLQIQVLMVIQCPHQSPLALKRKGNPRIRP